MRLPPTLDRDIRTLILPNGSGWSCRTTYAVITLATLAIGTGRVAPGPATTPSR
jgi:hypothetical protein